MIQGIGTDIIEVQRIAKAIERNGNFILKGFTKSEQEYFRIRNNNPHTIAGIFAAKEAVFKAISFPLFKSLMGAVNSPFWTNSFKVIQ